MAFHPALLPPKKAGKDQTKFAKEETETLKVVVSKFKSVKTNEIIEISHSEQAWQKNFKSGKSLISYIDAFQLVSI